MRPWMLPLQVRPQSLRIFAAKFFAANAAATTEELVRLANAGSGALVEYQPHISLIYHIDSNMVV